MEQKCNKNNRHQVDLPVYRKSVRPISSRCPTRESVGRSGCKVGVEWRGKNRGRGIDGQGDDGGSENVTNRVCGIILRGINEGGEGAIVDGVKEVNQDDNEDGEDIIEIHGGGCEEEAETEEGRFMYP